LLRRKFKKVSSLRIKPTSSSSGVMRVGNLEQQNHVMEKKKFKPLVAHHEAHDSTSVPRNDFLKT